MSMRPSFRCARIRAPLPSCDFILGSNSLASKTGLAGAAGPPAFRFADRPAARPGKFHEWWRQRRRQLGFRRVVDRINPLHLGLAELARAVALVQRIEHAALARRAVLDVGVARERRDG